MTAAAASYPLVAYGESGEDALLRAEQARARESVTDRPSRACRDRCWAVGLDEGATDEEIAAAEAEEAIADLPLAFEDATRLPSLERWAAEIERLRAAGLLTVGLARSIAGLGAALSMWGARAELRVLEAEEARQAAQERGPRKRRAA